MALRLPHRADADREKDIPQLRLDEVSQVGQKMKGFFGLLQQALIGNLFALQIQFIRFLLYGTHHILLDKTRWRHVAAHRHQVIAVQSDHRADRV